MNERRLDQKPDPLRSDVIVHHRLDQVREPVEPFLITHVAIITEAERALSSRTVRQETRSKGDRQNPELETRESFVLLGEPSRVGIKPNVLADRKSTGDFEKRRI